MRFQYNIIDDAITPLINLAMNEKDFTQWGISTVNHPTEDSWTTFDEIYALFKKRWGVSGRWVYPFRTEENAQRYYEMNKTIFEGLLDVYLPQAQKMFETTQYEYNPIENYNRYDDSDGYTQADKEDVPTTTETQKPKNWQTEQERDLTNVKVKHEDDLPNYTDDTSNSGFANDSQTMTPTQSVSRTYSSHDIDTTTYEKVNPNGRGEVTTTTQSGEFETEKTVQGKTNRHDEGHSHGNIGVTTTQRMIEQEREIIINVLDWLVDKLGNAVDLSLPIPW